MAIQALHAAIQSLNAPDVFKPRLTLDQWRYLEGFLVRHELRRGQTLIKQGERERTLYFLERGTLHVFVDKPRPGQRLSLQHAGTVVGEAGLFSDQPRMAHVEAVSACVVWALLGPRYEELTARNPALALELARSAAALMGQRMRANYELGLTAA
jgi:CRP/FNR family transcriptional regulator, cyclic AMP receptor protein